MASKNWLVALFIQVAPWAKSPSIKPKCPPCLVTTRTVKGFLTNAAVGSAIYRKRIGYIITEHPHWRYSCNNVTSMFMWSKHGTCMQSAQGSLQSHPLTIFWNEWVISCSDAQQRDSYSRNSREAASLGVVVFNSTIAKHGHSHQLVKLTDGITLCM